MNTASASKSHKTTITIHRVEGRAALYHRYPRQTSRQPCYVWLDAERRELGADVKGEIGNGVPARVWHGHQKRWSIPALTADAANALLAKIAPEAERICDGYESRWDGSNHVADYSDDAIEAIESVERLCDDASDDDQVQVWDASEWLGGIGDSDAQRRELGITAATTDEELEALAERLRAEAEDDDVDEIEGLERRLEWLRDSAEEE